MDIIHTLSETIFVAWHLFLQEQSDVINNDEADLAEQQGNVYISDILD